MFDSDQRRVLQELDSEDDGWQDSAKRVHGEGAVPVTTGTTRSLRRVQGRSVLSVILQVDLGFWLSH